MRTLGSLRPDKRRRIAQETLEIYTPLAHRLGIEHLKNELEDLCFSAMYPHRYNAMKMAIEMARSNKQELIERISGEIQAKLAAVGIPCRIYGKERPLYYLYQKMQAKEQHFYSILDIYSFRVVVDSIDTCYRVLGQMHALYKPRPFQVKDYIAVPKTNGYQSLHTAMIGHKGVPIDVLIRTEEMDQAARFGVAAHWGYKEQETSVQLRAQQWLKSIVEMQQSAENSAEFIENVKSDLFSSDIYVFTPKGRIVQLPANATPVDFAYAVHTDIGDRCIGAVVDHNAYPLSKPLQSGQTIEIQTAETLRDNSLWLSSVVTSKARSCIRSIHKRQTTQGQNNKIEKVESEPLRQYIVPIRLDIVDHQGALAEITSSISAFNSDIREVHSQEKSNTVTQLNLNITVDDPIHLANILEHLSLSKGVIQAVENKR